METVKLSKIENVGTVQNNTLQTKEKTNDTITNTIFDTLLSILHSKVSQDYHQ